MSTDSTIVPAEREQLRDAVAGKLGEHMVNPYSLGAAVWERLLRRYGAESVHTLSTVSQAEFDAEAGVVLREAARDAGADLSDREIEAVIH